MGYLVETSGRVLLPEEREQAAFEAVRRAMADRDGWYDPDHPLWPVDTLADLVPYVADVVLSRDGDWLIMTTDQDGDPKWSEQATAFYVELARWVDDGEVELVGIDENRTTWRYTYADGGLTQTGINGWDGSAEPLGDATDVAIHADDDMPLPPPPQRRRWFGQG